MKRHHCSLIFSLVIAWGFLNSLAHAQTKPIERSVKEATTAAPYAAAINTFVLAQVADLQSTTPSVQQAAREELANAVFTVGTTAGSPGFLDEYAKSVNANIGPALKDPRMRTRLNAAIAIQRIAKVAGNTRLVDSSITLLNDPLEPIVIWGVKSAGSLLPSVLPAQNVPGSNNAKLLPAIAAAVAKHPTGSATNEAYSAFLPLTSATPPVPDAIIQAVVPTVISVFESRVKVYIHEVPEQPQVEGKATLFLTERRTWNLLEPKQQLQVVQLMSDLLSLSIQHLPLLNTREERNPVINMIQSVSGGLVVVGLHTNDKAIQDAAKLVSQMNDATPDSQRTALVQSLRAALKANALFSDLQPAPAIQPNKQDDEEPAPTTQPTTSAGTRPAK